MLLTRRDFVLALAAAGPPPGVDVRVLQAFSAINEIRRKYKRAELAWSDAIAKAAQSQAERMARLGFFSHVDPQWGDLRARLARFRISWRFSAENLFSEEGYDNPVPQAVNGWMRSPGHRSNILSRYPTETGIGLGSDGGGRVWLAQIFILPR